MLRSMTVTVLLGLAACACTNTTPNTAISPPLVSGVTSSNGGGTRTVGSVNSQGITPLGTTTTSTATKGNAY